MIADAMCHVAQEACYLMEQWSEHIGELCGLLKALCVASDLHSGKALGEKADVHLTKT